MDKEAVKPAVESAAITEWHLPERDRLVVRYEFASRQWSGYVEPYNDLTGEFGERRDLSRAQIETIRGFRSGAVERPKHLGFRARGR